MGNNAYDQRLQSAGKDGYLLQRIEAHSGFKQFRLGYTASDDLFKIISMDEGETI